MVTDSPASNNTSGSASDRPVPLLAAPNTLPPPIVPTVVPPLIAPILLQPGFAKPFLTSPKLRSLTKIISNTGRSASSLSWTCTVLPLHWQILDLLNHLPNNSSYGFMRIRFANTLSLAPFLMIFLMFTVHTRKPIKYGIQ